LGPPSPVLPPLRVAVPPAPPGARNSLHLPRPSPSPLILEECSSPPTSISPPPSTALAVAAASLSPARAAAALAAAAAATSGSATENQLTGYPPPPPPMQPPPLGHVSSGVSTAGASSAADVTSTFLDDDARPTAGAAVTSGRNGDSTGSSDGASTADEDSWSQSRFLPRRRPRIALRLPTWEGSLRRLPPMPPPIQHQPAGLPAPAVARILSAEVAPAAASSLSPSPLGDRPTSTSSPPVSPPAQRQAIIVDLTADEEAGEEKKEAEGRGGDVKAAKRARIEDESSAQVDRLLARSGGRHAHTGRVGSLRRRVGGSLCAMWAYLYACLHVLASCLQAALRSLPTVAYRPADYHYMRPHLLPCMHPCAPAPPSALPHLRAPPHPARNTPTLLSLSPRCSR